MALLIPQTSSIFRWLEELLKNARIVFFAGLPGTGKSLFINQLAHLVGKDVTLLQWDVARPHFEAAPTGRKYPQVNGVTHGLIRVAAGRWARHAVGRHREGFLIGETPLIGNRFMELTRPLSDDAEAVLTAPTTRFVIPVPSKDVRRHAESERARRFQNPMHPREKEDAPPHVMAGSYGRLMEAAAALNLPSSKEYDPEAYAGVYRHLLRRRNVAVLPIDEILPTSSSSAYRFSIPTRDLVPTPDEAEQFLRETESNFDERRLDQWFRL
jgi:hypothetical protein